MPKPTTITSLEELYRNTVWFDTYMREQFDDLSEHMQGMLSRSLASAKSFIVFPRPDGTGYYVGFSKIVAYNIDSIPQYDRWRIEMSGTNSERAVDTLNLSDDFDIFRVVHSGGSTIGVSTRSEREQGFEEGSPRDAVARLLARAGKTPNSISRIRLMPLSESAKQDDFPKSPAYDVLLAALKAADLTAAERKRLFAEAA